jgi:hypothetical protein
MKKVTIIFLMAFLPFASNAQKVIALNYSMGVPASDLKSFISEVSFRGVEFSYLTFVDSNISVGASAAWNVFYERRANDQFNYNTITVTGTQYRYTNSLPVYAIANYHFNTKKQTTFYAGLGVGTIYTDRDVDFGIYNYSVDAWQFAVAPQLGFAHKINVNTNLHFGARYNLAFDSSELDGQSFLSMNVGLAWKVW